jgi:hypothetical protein
MTVHDIQNKSDEGLCVGIIKFQPSLCFPETKSLLDAADL